MASITSFIRLGLLFAILATTGCAATQHSTEVNDPYEDYNRFMYSFNDKVDRAVTKPIAKGYNYVMPDVVSKSVSNFFRNLDDITVIINDVLQLKINQAIYDTGRFVTNSTIGVLGLFDVATPSGLKKNDEDFGQTLGYWGIDTGAYIVLPLLGPSNVRDTFGLVGDHYTDPLTYVEGPAASNPLYATRIIDDRADLLSAEKVLDEAAMDEYNYVRDGYLQRRLNLVHDGNPPEDDFDVFED